MPWRRWFSRQPLRNKLVLVSTLVSIIALLLSGLTLVANEYVAFRDSLATQARAMADVVGYNADAYISFLDLEEARRALAQLSVQPHIREARLYVNEGFSDPPKVRQLARFSSLAEPMSPVHLTYGDHYRFTTAELEVMRPIVKGGNTLGYVYIRYDLGDLWQQLQRFVAAFVLSLLLSVAVAWMLSRRLQATILRPVNELVATSVQVRRERDYALRAKHVSDDELGTLTNAFNAMLAEIQSRDAARERVQAEIRQLNDELEIMVATRTRQLEQKNAKLTHTIEHLKDTQAQLVEAEKMAALGALVAGVAHEINTPLGIGVTATTYLETQLDELKEHFANGMRKSDLESFIAQADESVKIVTRNLQRAAELIRSFKQVAVDQTNEKQRDFNVREYLGEVLLSLRPKLKHTHIQVELECDEDLVIQSYPGVLAQIVTNLVLNSLLHGFEAEEKGEISLQVQRIDDELHLRYHDSGHGMDEATRARVFEPFFTTRRGQGGTGLGLHIAYNQITQTLGGSIECSSSPDRGTTFSIRFPVQQRRT